MVSLRSLTERIEVGDYVVWVSEQAFEHAGETTHPNTVTDVKHRGNTIRIDGEGDRGGKYFYRVDETRNSEAFFVDPNKSDPIPKGDVAFAERTDSKDPVRVRRGYYDTVTE